MHKPQPNMSDLRVITISQQYGSDGDKIAAELAFRLQWRCINQQIAAQVAELLEITEAEAAFHDERAYNVIDRFLLSLCFSTSEAWNGQYTPQLPQTQERLYREALQHVIEGIAHAGKSVIVGHAGQILLADRPDVLHVRIVAPFAQRVSRVMQGEHLDQHRAQARVRKNDRCLEYYLRSQYHRDINDPLLYDLVINNYPFDMESQINLISLAFERKARGFLLLATDYSSDIPYSLPA